MKPCPIKFIGLALIIALCPRCKSLNKDKQVSIKESLTPSLTQEKPRVLSDDVAIIVVDNEGSPLSNIKIIADNQTPLGTTDSFGKMTSEFQLQTQTKIHFRGPHIVNSTVLWQSSPKPLVVSIKRKRKIEIDVGKSSPKDVGPITFFARSTSGMFYDVSFSSDQTLLTTWLPDGQYRFWLQSNRHATAKKALFVASDVTTKATLIKGFSVNGKIIGKSYPTSGAILIESADPKNAYRQAVLFADGTFSVHGLAEGKWFASLFSKTHFSAKSTEFTLAKDVTGLHVDSSPKHSIKGRVLDSKGQPLENVNVMLPESMSAHSAFTNQAPWVYPLAGKKRLLRLSKSRVFGAARPGIRPLECLKGHCGIDIGFQKGQGILAASSGQVIKIQNKDIGRAGKFVKINHNDAYTTWYIHLDSISPHLDIGTKVKAGEKIGTLGDSGIKRSKPHLHFGVAVNQGNQSIYIDPLRVLSDSILVDRATTTSYQITKNVLVATPSNEQDDSVAKTEEGHLQSVTTDKDGWYAFQSIDTLSPLLVYNHPHFLSSFLNVTLSQPSQVVPEIAMVPFRQKDGKTSLPPDANGLFSIHTEWGEEGALSETKSVPIKRDGTFSLNVPPIPFSLVISKEEKEHQRFLVDRKSFDFYSLTIQDKIGTIRIKAHDVSGLKASDAIAEILTDTKSAETYASDNDGHLIIDKLGTQKIHLLIDAPWSYPQKVSLVPSQKWHEVVLPFGMRLEIPLRLENGDAPPKGTELVLRKGEQKKICKSTPKGKCFFSGLKPGLWSFTTKHSRFSKNRVDIKITNAKTRNQVTVAKAYTLTAGVTISGVIRDENGNRLSNASILFGSEKTETDLDGFYKIKSLKYGSHKLKINKDALGLMRTILIEPGNPHRAMDWVLRKESDK